MFGDVHRILSRHCVNNEQDLGRIDLSLYVAEFLHQLFVNRQASRSVNDNEVIPAV